MEADFSLKDSSVGIFGLGLMGGSLALGLKGHCARLVGYDTDPPTLELALSRKIIDQTVADPVGVLPPVDVLILATPVPAILDLLKQLPLLIPDACVVVDIGSSKYEIVQAMESLPERFDPIGGHPICGQEKLGLENADASLYQGAAFVVTPLERSTCRARSAARQIISVLGAQPLEMAAQEHDRVLASTSHLPYLLSSALAHAASQEPFPLIGPGFRSASRLAGTPARMMLGVLSSNRQNVLSAVRRFHASLDEIESALQAEDYTQLESTLNQCRSAYVLLTAS